MSSPLPPRTDPASEMWFAADTSCRLKLETPHGPIFDLTLPGAALLASFGSAVRNAPGEGEILRFTAMVHEPACGDPDCCGAPEECDQDQAPPVLHAYRIVIQESKDQGQTWG